MLDPWIIEEIRRREEEQRREDARRAVLEMPLPFPEEGEVRDRPAKDEETPRGVTIIDFRIC